MQAEGEPVRAKDVMTPAPVTVLRRTPVKKAARLMVEKAVNALPVVEEDGRLVGIVSGGDLIGLETEPDPRLHLAVIRTRRPVPRSVEEVMTRVVLSMPEDADAADVARAMLDARVKQIPIVRDGRVVGIVGRRDLLALLARDDAAVEADVQTMLDGAEDLIGVFRAAVSGGVATLAGPANPQARRLAERLARAVPGTITVVFADEPSVSAGAS